MTIELSNICEKDNTFNLKEKFGIGLAYLSALPLIPYIYNVLITKSIEKPEILTSVASHSGNAAHLGLLYCFTKSKNIMLLATAYHVLGEILHSEIAPNLPQILPGTPDVKDIPLTITMGLGLYLVNKKF